MNQNKINIKAAKRTLEDGNIINRIWEMHKDLLSKSSEHLAQDLSYQGYSTHAPDLIYSGNDSRRKKRPQENTLIVGSGGIGINTVVNASREIFTSFQVFRKITHGSLTSMSGSIAKALDHSVVFLNEFGENSKDLMADIKAMTEEGRLDVARSYAKGQMTHITTNESEPSLIIGTNKIPNGFDNPLISRFDNFHRIRGSKQLFREITDKMSETIGNPSAALSSKTLKDLSEFSNAARYLKECHDRKIKIGKKKYDSIEISFDGIRDKFLEHKNKILDKQNKMGSIFSRDLEIGFRRTNTNAWMNHPVRDMKIVKKVLIIEASDEDLKEGVKSLRSSYESKRQFFRERWSHKSKNSDARSYWLKNVDKTLPARKQAEILKEKGYDISHVSVSKWNKEVGDC